MRKIIMLCLLLVAIGVRAESEFSSRKYGDLLVEKNIQSDGSALYGLSFDERQILSVGYQFDYNEKLRLLVFYNYKEVYVFDAYSIEPLFIYRFDEVQKEFPKITYTSEEILQKVCYRLEIKGDTAKINGGIFSIIDGQICELIFNPL